VTRRAKDKKNSCFHIFLDFHFIARLSFRVAKEWTAKVQPFMMNCPRIATLDSWNSKINLYSNCTENKSIGDHNLQLKQALKMEHGSNCSP